MGPSTTPSLISKGGVSDTPPPGVGRNRHPLGNRVKSCWKFGFGLYVKWKIGSVIIFNIFKFWQTPAHWLGETLYECKKAGKK